LWRCSFEAEGTLFHEWQHANDYYTGTIDLIKQGINKPSLQMLIIEYRAYQWNPYDSYYIKNILKPLNQYFSP
jgi:hypothetical protein